MKVIIAGSRTIRDVTYVESCIGLAIAENDIDVTEVVSGGAVGVDSIGEGWARSNGILVKWFLPRWELYGRRAGPMRNKKMAKYADVLIAIWDGKSRGTANMIKEMTKLRKPVVRFEHREEKG